MILREQSRNNGKPYSILVAAVRSEHGWSVGFQEGGVFGGHFYSLKKIFAAMGYLSPVNLGVFKITKVELFFSFPKNAHSLENDDTGDLFLFFVPSDPLS